jgi:hypothetical protein
MDADVESPVLIVPFGGDEFDLSQWDDSNASGVVLEILPQFFREGFFCRCTRILDKLLVKVLVETDGSWW